MTRAGPSHDMTQEECWLMCVEQLLASLRHIPNLEEPLPEHVPRICLAAAQVIEELLSKALACAALAYGLPPIQ